MRVGVPVQQIWGTRDEVFGNPAFFREDKELLPHARMTKVYNATHYGLLSSEALVDEVFKLLGVAEVSEWIPTEVFFGGITEEDFKTLVGWALCFCICVTGYTLELYMLTWIGKSNLDEEQIDVYWRVAKASFPLMISCAVLSHSRVGVLMYTLGMWKFGFPETISYAVLALQQKSRVMMALNLVTGVAMFSHHVGSTVIYAMVISGAVHADQGIIAVGCALVAIHFCTNLTEFEKTKTIALVMALVCEVWMQAEAISYSQTCHGAVWLGVWMILWAHYGCLACTVIGLIRSRGQMSGAYFLEEDQPSDAVGLTDDTDPAEQETVSRKHRGTISIFQGLGNPSQSMNSSSRTVLSASRKSVFTPDSRKSLFVPDSRTSVFMVDKPSGMSSMVEATRRQTVMPPRSEPYL